MKDIFPTPETPDNSNTFRLPGFFDHVNLQELRVGNKTYRVPDFDDIATLYKAELESRSGKGFDDMKEVDKKHGSESAKSVEYLIEWVHRGIEELKRGMEPEARRSFEMAQTISRTMAKRYMPDRYEEPGN